MTIKNKHLNTSDDLHLYRFGNGVKLVATDQTAKLKTCQFAHDTGFTVGSTSRLPLSFYFLNTDSATEKINQEGVNVCGFESSNKSVGKSLLDVSNESSAVSLMDNCRQVMTSNEIKIFEETNMRKDGLMQQFLSIKAPWYDSHDRIIGVCGFSIVLGRHSLAESLSTITRMGLLTTVNVIPQRQHSQDLTSFNLSKREEECLRLTLKGSTAKKIARMLDLSHRTVEEYLTNIKIKMGVKSKSELIELAVNFYSHVQDG